MRCGPNSRDFAGGEAAVVLIEEQAGQFHVAGPGDFDVAFAAEDDADFDGFEALDEARFIGAGEAIAAGLLESLKEDSVAEHLGRLGEDEALAREGGADFGAGGLRAADLLDGIDGNDADDGGAVGTGFLDGAVDDFYIDKGADSVMNGDEVGIGREGEEGVFDGLLTGIAAGDGVDVDVAFFFVEKVAKKVIDPLDVVRADGNYDLADFIGEEKLAHGVGQDGGTIEQHELFAAGASGLGDSAAHPRAQARGGQNDGDSAHGYYSRLLRGEVKRSGD